MRYFDIHHGMPFDRYDHEPRSPDPSDREPSCKRCGSTDVRWRQQGGRWVLFSLKPGVEHSCVKPEDFDDLDAKK